MSLMHEESDGTDGAGGRGMRLTLLLAAVLGVLAVLVAVWIFAVQRSTPPPPALSEPGPDPVAQAPASPPALTPAVPADEPRPRPRTSRPKAATPPPEPAPPPSPETGTVHVTSDVAGASVFLDREFKGTAPVTIEAVPPGPHRLNVSAEGFDGHAETLEVAVGPQTVAVRFREVRLSETVPVVHKHTIGSCSGRLVADPHGIRYETTNKDDAFRMAHGEIETFEVDYLKKNLRIKKRGGRTYNFANDNADALFVFHRNVQAARERLAKGDPPAPAK